MLEEIALAWAKDAPALLVAGYVIYRLFNLIESLITTNREAKAAAEKRSRAVNGAKADSEGISQTIDGTKGLGWLE